LDVVYENVVGQLGELGIGLIDNRWEWDVEKGKDLCLGKQEMDRSYYGSCSL